MKNLIYLSCIRWDIPAKLRPHHFCDNASAQGYRVLYAVLHETSPHISIQKTDRKNIYLLKIPIPAYSNFVSGGSVSSPETVEQLADFCGDDETIIMVNAPYWSKIAIGLRNKLSNGILNYDVLDRIEHFEDLAKHRERLLRMHENLLRAADLVTYTAKDMEGYVSKCTTEPFYLSNGCDPEVWDVPRNPYLKRPIVGYFGVMAYWFDTKVISYLIGQRELRIELAGSMALSVRNELFPGTDIRRVNQYLGLLEYHKLPQYASKWSVGLIPFIASPLTQATDPNKFYEYYALGLPVVATELNELKKISNDMPHEIRPILLGNARPRDWHSAVLEAFENDNGELITMRKAWAKKHSWDSKFNKLLELVNDSRDSRSSHCGSDEL